MINRRTLFAIACLELLTFGIVLTTLGAVLPVVIERFGIGKADAGSLILLNTFGIVLGSVVFGPLVDRWGYKEILLFGTAVVIIGLEGTAFATSMPWLRAAVLLSGFGGGVVNGGTNALVADITVEERTAGMGKLHAFFCLGALGVPFALGSLLGLYSYAVILGAVGALVLVPLVAIVVVVFPAPKHAQGFPLASAKKLLRDPLLLSFGLMGFLESGMEITVGGWTTTFFREELQVSDRDALIYLSLYWLGMMVGRMGLGAALRMTTATRLLLGCLTVAFAGSLLLITTHTRSLAALGVFALGLGFSAVFPTLLSFAAERYATLSGTAIGAVMVMALTGGMLLPYATGVLGASYGLRASLAMVPIASVILATVLSLVRARLSPARETDPPSHQRSSI